MIGDLSVLPHLNASLNATSALFLLSGYYFIKRLRIKAHRNCQVAALITSTLFLISYLTYHYYHGDTRFLGQGIVRPFYFAMLISHVILAIVLSERVRHSAGTGLDSLWDLPIDSDASTSKTTKKPCRHAGQ